MPVSRKATTTAIAAMPKLIRAKAMSSVARIVGSAARTRSE
ncbi:MAG TPA: hypothetical protein VFE89_00740 [Beijerinckiaceae bacterium]|jgi:hypothetical protein|nr:hypothetical protein [Beijerinckiaceae bacterium]